MISNAIIYLLITFNLICLAFAAYSDWKTRLILDRIWVVQLIGGIVFLYHFFTTNQNLLDRILVIINILFGVLFLMVLIFSRILGVGDMKGFFVISISYPIYYTYFESTIFPYPQTFPPFFAILLNFFLYLTLFAVFNFLRNLILTRNQKTFDEIEGSSIQKISLMIEGVRVDVSDLENWKFYNPGEIYQEGKWHLFTPNYDSLMDDETFEELERREKEEMIEHIKISEKKQIWIRPQVPGMVILFFSYLTTVLIGTPFGRLFEYIAS